jgi:hypothetical protein
MIGRPTECCHGRLGRQHECRPDREKPGITKKATIGFPDGSGGSGMPVEAGRDSREIVAIADNVDPRLFR